MPIAPTRPAALAFALSVVLVQSVKGHPLDDACAEGRTDDARRIANELAARAHGAWDRDEYADAIPLYDELLVASCGCNGTVTCAALPRMEQLQVHANMASSLMMRARDKTVPTAERGRMLARSAFHWQVPLSIVPQDAHLQYFSQLVGADHGLAAALASRADEVAVAEREGALMRVEPIERRAAASITREQFVTEFATPRRPVVLTGVLDGVRDDDRPSLQEIMRVCGEKLVTVQRRRPAAAAGAADLGAWAGLESALSEISLNEYYAAAEEERADGWQVFDWSLPRHCPEWAARWRAPELLSGANLLDGLPLGAEGRAEYALGGGWPSLFVQPVGSSCGAHIDAYGTHFWQLPLNGTKRWRVVHVADAHLLAPVPPRTRTLQVEELFEPDYAAHPQLRLARVREAYVQPGEAIFVPAGAAHQVANVGASPHGASPTTLDGAAPLVAALSGNLIDGTNAEEALRELFFGAELGTRDDVARTLEYVKEAAAKLATQGGPSASTMPQQSSQCES